MTFYEAAIEVLMVAERPLHYKKITEIAIQKKLLSHVGKTPEVTMGARLIQEIKKHEGPSAQIVRTRPGVYALRSWDAKPTPPEVVAEPPAETPAPAQAAEAPSDQDSGGEDEGRGRPRRRRRRRRGEEDEQQAQTQRTAAPVQEKRAEPDKVVEAADAVEAAEADLPSPKTEAAPSESKDASSESRDDGRGRGRRARGGRGRRGRREDAEPEATGGFTSRSKAPTSRSEEPRPSSREDVRASAPANGKSSSAQEVPAKEKGEPTVVTHLRFEVAGVSIRAEKLCEVVLEVLEATGQPMVRSELVAQIAERYSMPPVIDKLEGMVTAALVADNEVRRAQGRRQLFQQTVEGSWALTAWGLDAESLKLESDLYKLSNDLQTRTLELLAKQISALSFDACQQLLMTLLKQQGYVLLSTRKRCSNGDLVLSTEHRRGLSTERAAIRLSVLKTLGAEAVTELRGTLHHHNASRGVVVTTGEVSDEALEESRIENLAPITLIDCTELARMLHASGIGTQRFELSVPFVNQAFFDALS